MDVVVVVIVVDDPLVHVNVHVDYVLHCHPSHRSQDHSLVCACIPYIEASAPSLSSPCCYWIFPALTPILMAKSGKKYCDYDWIGNSIEMGDAKFATPRETECPLVQER